MVIQDEAGQALSGHHIKALERHQRSADPGRNGKKKSIMRVKKKKARKSSKRMVNKKGKRNNRNSKGKKVSGMKKKTKKGENNKDRKSKRSKKVKKDKKLQKKLKIGRKIQKKSGMKEQREGKKNKKRTKKEKKNQVSKDSSCLPIVCIDNAVKALNQLKGKVVSFEKQLKRYGKLSTQAVNKVGKKGVFKPALMRLQQEGGGNASGLSCGGNLTNAGALQMQNLSSLLTACEGQVLICF